MRQFTCLAGLHLVVFFGIGCAPEVMPTGLADLLGVDTSTGGDNVSPTAQPRSHMVDGSVGTADYRLFEIGATAPGDEWTITSVGFFTGTFTVALFDEHYELLDRSALAGGNSLKHRARLASERTYLGIMPAFGGAGGSFSFSIRQSKGGSVPDPRPQKVYLNFEGGSTVSVNGRPGISFSRFRGSDLGGPYEDATNEVITALVENMRSDYAAFNVTFYSSREGPPPEGEYSTVHFGGNDPGLLGLADSVDLYNADRTQNAIVFVETFADYVTMDLSPEEMGVMLANVASHELGHLLGLYHTRDPGDLMDTTGSAWDLAADQAFSTAPLDTSVFVMGKENSRQMLAHAVGYAPGGEEALDNPPVYDKMSRRALVRDIAVSEVRTRCGLCRNPDAGIVCTP